MATQQNYGSYTTWRDANTVYRGGNFRAVDLVRLQSRVASALDTVVVEAQKHISMLPRASNQAVEEQALKLKRMATQYYDQFDDELTKMNIPIDGPAGTKDIVASITKALNFMLAYVNVEEKYYLR